MNFDEYQKKTGETALYTQKILETHPGLPEEVIKILGVCYVGLGLGEAGEVQNKIKKIVRDHGGVITPEVITSIKKELGDILWYVSRMCEELGISMNDVAEENIAKLLSRKDRGVIVGSGDDR